jgi:hypothetical protein
VIKAITGNALLVPQTTSLSAAMLYAFPKEIALMAFTILL